jgi:hypothetical protein
MAQLLTLDEAASLNPLDAALVAIGFTKAQARILMESDFVDYDSFKLINKKDVLMVADSYGKRSTVSEQIQFGSTRLNRLVGLMHLVQDYARRGILADTNGMLPVTLDFIKMALQHTLIREDHANNKEIASKAADPGTLTFKVDFQSWTHGFRNYLNTIPGVTCIPLDYMIRDKVEPDIQEDVDYMVGLVLQAPLTVPPSAQITQKFMVTW